MGREEPAMDVISQATPLYATVPDMYEVYLVIGWICDGSPEGDEWFPIVSPLLISGDTGMERSATLYLTLQAAQEALLKRD